MSVRAKFFVSKAENPEGAAAAQVELGAVCRGVENAMWAQATPGGFIRMTVKNSPAFEQFVQGEEYEVTFTRVAKPVAGDGHPIKVAADMYGRELCETCGQTLGYTEKAVESSPHLAEYNTETKRADQVALHDEVFGEQ